MADTTTGIRLEALGEQEFSNALNNAAESMDNYAASAQNAAGATGGLAEALDQATLDQQRAADLEELATASANLATGLAQQAEGAAKLVGALFDAATETADYGDAIDKQSQKLGLSRREYQEWSYVLGQSGASVSSMKSAMQQLAKVQEGLTKTAADDLEALGLSLEGVQSLSRGELFAAVIEGLQGMEESSERAMLAQRLLGSGYKELQPLLNTSAEATQALVERFYTLGGYMSDEAVDAAAAYGDVMDDLNLKFDATKRELLVGFLPALTELRESLLENDSLDRLADQAGALAEKGVGALGWIVEHSDGVITAVEGIGAAFVGWKALGVVGTLVTNLQQLYSWLGMVGGLVGAGALATGGAIAVAGLGAYTVADYVNELNTAGYLGKGHELEEYAANVAAAEEAVAQWHARNDEYFNSGFTEGLEMLNSELGVLEAAVHNAREEYEAMQEAAAQASEAPREAPQELAQSVETSAEQLAAASETLLETIDASAGEIRSDWVEGLDGMADDAAAEIVAANDAMAQNADILAANAYTWGQRAMIELANGIRAGANAWVLPTISEVSAVLAARPTASVGGGGGSTINYGGVNMSVYGAEGQSVDALADEIYGRLQYDVAGERAVYAN